MKKKSNKKYRPLLFCVPIFRCVTQNIYYIKCIKKTKKNSQSHWLWVFDNNIYKCVYNVAYKIIYTT